MTAIKYSGGAVTIQQLALMDVLGKPFPQIMRNLILDPIGMANSTFEQPLPPAREKQAARAHDGSGRARSPKWHVYREMAAAGLWTTPTDMAQFLIEAQMTLVGKSHRVLTQKTMHEMVSPVGVGPYAVALGSKSKGKVGISATAAAIRDSSRTWWCTGRKATVW